MRRMKVKYYDPYGRFDMTMDIANQLVDILPQQTKITIEPYFGQHELIQFHLKDDNLKLRGCYGPLDYQPFLEVLQAVYGGRK